jgi:3-oxoadipate enol-lactonase
VTVAEQVRTGAALGALVDAVRQLEGLTAQVGPFVLPDDTDDAAPALVEAVCRTLAVPLEFTAPSGRGRDFALVALAAEIRAAQADPALRGTGPADIAPAVERIVAAQDAGMRHGVLTRPDGALVAAVDAGPQDAPCVVLSPPCALDHRLCLPWLDALRDRYRVVVARTRGTCERIVDPADFERRGCGVPEQAGDLLDLLDTLGGGPVHLMGLCGGAAVALAAAAEAPGRVGSLSLWHADLDLGDAAEKTDHQINLRATLDLAGESRETAAWLRERLTGGPMTGVPSGIGPLVVRPYATAELFHRYARLAGATMHWDSRTTAARVAVPGLVVTSADDATAHPAGSRAVAALLPRARLVVAEHGDHLNAFRATDAQVAALTTFLEGR